MDSVLIFGCNGFVGKYLIDEFKTHDYIVYGSGCEEHYNDNLDGYDKADLCNYNEVFKIILKRKPNYIVNLAAVSSVGESWKIPQLTIQVNIIGTLNILESVKIQEVKTKILLIGSSEEYAISNKKMSENHNVCANNPYGVSKVTQEQFSDIYREEFGLNIVNTRTFNHTGLGQPEQFVIPSFVKQIAEIHKSGQPGIIRVGNLNVKRDLGDVRDMVSAYRMILESSTKQKVFNVGSGMCYYLKDVLDYIVSLSDQPIMIEVDSAKIRPIDNPIIWCDNTLITSEIGWRPKYTVYDAIDKMYAFYIAN